ncbi:MAG: lytic murein transglycosylase B [Methylococcaceae bacterium]|nr:lytic murein transglycosylase B [Methylococcaceae bacterium]
MIIKKILLSLLLIISIAFSSQTLAEIKSSRVVNNFINTMVKKHRFSQKELKKLFKSAKIKKSILKAISRPAEGRMTWHKYRQIFMTEARISGGVNFWRQHRTVLANVEQKYGVPWPIIVAIIGVETQYGGNTGSYRVIDALSTLAFAYPKRSKFFTSELENFLLLCREEKINPLKPKGSYAGAMGLPQFMPSSFRKHAADYEMDKHRNIWTNPADAIASVGNYLQQYGWARGQGIAYPVSASGTAYTKALSKDLKPNVTLAQLQALHVQIPAGLPLQSPAKLLDFKQANGKELWVGLNNFYVITRYNHSRLYAMAVYQLSMAISTKVETLARGY